MILIEPILFFIFILTILIVLRSVFRLISSLLSNPPQRLVMNNWELFFLGISISFILTYLIKL